MSQYSQLSQLSQISSVAPSSKSGKAKSKKGVRHEEDQNSSVQLVRESNRFQTQIMEFVQNMKPTMDPQRQGLIDYMGGVIRKLNDEEWDDFEEQLCPIVRQFASR